MNLPEKHDAAVSIDLTGLESKLRDYCAGLVAMSAGYDASAYHTPNHRIKVGGEWATVNIDSVLYGVGYEADLVLLRQDAGPETRWYIARRQPGNIDFTVEQHYYVAGSDQKTAVIAQALSVQPQ